MVRAAGRPAEVSGTRNDSPIPARDVTRLSEIPCRVSSDLHEWHNDWSAVSGSDSANLLFR